MSSSDISGTAAYNATKAQSCRPFPNFLGSLQALESNQRAHRVETHERICLMSFIDMTFLPIEVWVAHEDLVEL